MLHSVSLRHMHNQRIREQPRSEVTLGCCLIQDPTQGRASVQGRAGLDQTQAMNGWLLLPLPTDTHTYHACTMQCCGHCPDLQFHVTTGRHKPGRGVAFIPSLATDTLSGHSVQHSVFSHAGTEGSLQLSTESLMGQCRGPYLEQLVISLMLPVPASTSTLLNLMAKAVIHKEIH